MPLWCAQELADPSSKKSYQISTNNIHKPKRKWHSALQWPGHDTEKKNNFTLCSLFSSRPIYFLLYLYYYYFFYSCSHLRIIICDLVLSSSISSLLSASFVPHHILHSGTLSRQPSQCHKFLPQLRVSTQTSSSIFFPPRPFHRLILRNFFFFFITSILSPLFYSSHTSVTHRNPNNRCSH